MPKHVLSPHNISVVSRTRLLPWLLIFGVSLAVTPGCRAQAGERAEGTSIEMSADGGTTNTASTSVRKLPDGRIETIKKSKTVARRIVATGEVVTTTETFERSTTGKRGGLDVSTTERRSSTTESTYEPRVQMSRRR